ncbi:hypothetical protein A1O7_03672 [Cladophialophora yegresii CBS 114405]|uniref:DNA2/NAM7 helicase helicase domain-containing protein n=1 Tax=Cladophialophora yegresii CBS 114405 TaxID=1182544 RepID=W9WE01_9EURO|nr:uncharacterized protein A1O7_03672 [Cladophialophora yegresii CBS 114405]EXJ63225.1 hypothetical protein A1O7_03672 [Cladophialophora yegresii CBS 114405]
MSFHSHPDSKHSQTLCDSVESRVRLSYQIEGESASNFIDLGTGSASPRSEYHCEIRYDGSVKIWNTIGNHRFSVEYEPKQVAFEALKKRNAGGEWVYLDPRYDSWTPSVRGEPDTQLVVRMLDDSPTASLSRANDAQRNSLATTNLFPLARSYKLFSRVKLQLLDASRDRIWRPDSIIRLITEAKLAHTRKDTQQPDHYVVMEDVLGTPETRDPHMKAFLDTEEAAIKAEGVDGEAITAAVRAMRAALSGPESNTTYRIPISAVFDYQAKAVKEVVPLAEKGYSVDFSPFDDINPSQERAIRNIFVYTASLIHAPNGCALTATIVFATEAILRKAPTTKVLICSRSNAAADKIDSGFNMRRHLCGFRFEHLRFLPRTTDELHDVRVVICTYATSGVGRLLRQWDPQVLIGDDAGRIRHYELIVPISAHLESLNRLVLLGDHTQNSPSASTATGRVAWERSIFESMMDRGWPQQLLDINYLTHSDLWYPTSFVFYHGLVTAARSTADPGPFLTKLLTRFDQGVEIEDSVGDTARISSFAHFFDVRDKQDESIDPEVSCVEVIVNALLQSDSCKADEIVVVHGAREYHDLLTSKSKSSGWCGVAIEHIASTQALSRKVAILCLPRSEVKLVDSPMSQRRNVSTMMSLASDAVFVVGTWKSICLLAHTNDLQRVLFCMDETIERFLLRVGGSPYTYSGDALVNVKAQGERRR